MYESYFKLSRNPFRMTPDPDLLFLTTAHREAFAGLTYAILGRKGCSVLTGDAGTGKTTLLAAVQKSIPRQRAPIAVLSNPTLTPSEFFEMVLLQFGVADISPSKAQRLATFERFLLSTDQAGQIPVLVVDEAQRLPLDVLEEIRLLTNFERADAKLLQIVLAGQPELNTILNRVDMRQFKQRVAIRLDIQPLSRDEVRQYIEYRWERSGSPLPVPFGPEALAEIVYASRGIPRLINVICDNALLLAFAMETPEVSADQVREALKDLHLQDPDSHHALRQNHEPPPVPFHLPGTLNGKHAAAPLNGFPATPAAAAPASVSGPAPKRPELNIPAPVSGHLLRTLERNGSSSGSSRTVWWWRRKNSEHKEKESK